ncbi:MAG: YtxH domain-containing protein [Armatimonadetes bacterium]|nr:YtxH domain-containing protein [Armatimonadota bacterium]
MNEGSKDFALGLIIGGLIGAAVALLYAPMAGVDARRRVGEKAGEFADDARGKATEVAGSVRGRAGEVVGTVRERAKETVDQARSGIEDLRGRFSASVDAGREAAQEKQEELEQRVEESAAPVIRPDTA